ncbi:hypothetical protein LJB81_02110 [Desulfovibrio sp. OttesenSCG-928-M14]|nr:hypothetical protein [Desulfovibrio sp. OttesenSCG-928-M16]MDL2216510.1 hypothetical protein [Desulfovibrio sp. OttesenSCG-928-M14]
MTKDPAAHRSNLSRPGYFVILALSVNILCLWFYHHHFYREPEVVTVDFRMLSEAKIGEWAMQAASGNPATPEKMDAFIRSLHAEIANAADGQPVFVTGAIFQGGRDLTEQIARSLNLDLSRKLVGSLSNMATRVEQGMWPGGQQPAQNPAMGQ